MDLVYGNSSGSGSQILQFDGKRLVAQENTTVTNIGNFTKISSSDVGDIDDMAKNTIQLLDKETLAQFKVNALAQANLFSLEVILPQYENIYRNLVPNS